ncbi:unnamed protein product [Orchesella dallaii]|uniref:Serpin domain-containing protein n=1 Tax=Orchesella dallaii TaxID=48710 RepID=A0ABP1QKI6_9HEXA
MPKTGMLEIYRLLAISVLIFGNTSGTSNEIPNDDGKVEPFNFKPPLNNENNEPPPVAENMENSTSISASPINTPLMAADTEAVPPAPPPPSPPQKNAVNQFAQRISPRIFGRPNKFQTVNVTTNSNSSFNATANKPSKPGFSSKPSFNSAPSKIPTIMWSPVSVFNALTPLLYAASGKTQVELQNVLLPTSNSSIKYPNGTVASSTSSSSSNYTYRFEEHLPKNSRQFSSATGLFSRVDSPLNSEYLLDVHRNVGNVDVKEVDFANVSVAVKNINSWVNQSTAGMIKEVVDEGQVDPATFLVIINCVRFKAMWIAPFEKYLTKISNFTNSNGEVQKAQMMTQRSTQRFAKFPVSQENEESSKVAPFKVLELPYEEGLFSSIFILPNSTDDLLSTMEYVETLGIENIRKMLGPVEVDIWMPKFSINSDVNVEEALVESGLTTLFNPSQANLTRLLPPPSLSHDKQEQERAQDDSAENSSTSSKSPTIHRFIPAPFLSKIVHRTIFEISEEGTQAGAVTSLSIVPLSALSDNHIKRFKADRPFILFLVKNNTIIFQGVIASLPEIDEDTQNTSNIPSRDGIVEAYANVTHNQVSERDNEKEEDRPWWIPPAVPVYLTNKTDSNKPNENSDANPAKSVNSEDVPDGSSVPAAAGAAPSPAETIDTESTVISFTKYQQPEPKDPTGIRFPSTVPQHRNHLIKPRLNDNVKIKTALLHWMNVY